MVNSVGGGEITRPGIRWALSRTGERSKANSWRSNVVYYIIPVMDGQILVRNHYCYMGLGESTGQAKQVNKTVT